MIHPELDEESLDRSRFPVDPWALRETSHRAADLGTTETLFAVGNGYLGMRGNPEEGRDAQVHGTFLNGFHETWEIQHAEQAFGFARTGQTVVNVPDAKVMKIYVDDEPLILGTADLEEYERSLDFAEGLLRRRLVWRTPAGKRVQVTSTRMVSMTERHLAVLELEVTLLDGNAPILISSQLLNRQDGQDEYHVRDAAMGESADPRKAQHFDVRVLVPQDHYGTDDRLFVGYRCRNSAMTLAVCAHHELDTANEVETVVRCSEDLGKIAYRVDAKQGAPIRLTKLVTYHSSRGVPVRELSDRCDRTLDRAVRHGAAAYRDDQRAWFDEFWACSDVEVEDHPALQQAIRFNLFHLAQAAARSDQQGVPAKGVTGTGYEGHYFWDTEVYVVPFLVYSLPEVARNTLHFRSRMLPAARDRAQEMAQLGALYPWRTINGEEASAYYAAGTAQVHIDADVAYALSKYVDATGDTGFLMRDGVDILVETARMYADLGFWRHHNGDGVDSSFHIHGVTGPDEYTTVVNNNLFTNVMARFNLERAVRAVDEVRDHDPVEHARMVKRLGLTCEEVGEWRRAAEAMSIPYEDSLGIHPQDEHFLDREVWDLSETPADLRPLLLHFHPLVIYRFQVLKQADVVLALFLQGDRFTHEEKRADFEYYDPITTGDSTLSAVVQSVIASEVGYHEVAMDYFRKSLYVDLLDLHGNAVDGMHVASAGGVWSALVCGFGGMRDHGGELTFDPRLPDTWPRLTFRLRWHGSRIRVDVAADLISFRHEEGTAPVPVTVRGASYAVAPGGTVEVPLDGQGPRVDGRLGSRPLIGGRRADGSRITAGVPSPSVPTDEAEHADHLI